MIIPDVLLQFFSRSLLQVVFEKSGKMVQHLHMLVDGGFDFHVNLLGFVRGGALFEDGADALSGLDGGFDFHPNSLPVVIAFADFGSKVSGASFSLAVSETHLATL